MRLEQVMGLVIAVMGVALVLLSRRLVWEHSPDNPAARDRGPGAAGVWSDRARNFHLWRGRIGGGVFVVIGLLLLTGVLLGN
jgi:hypothetical protein